MQKKFRGVNIVCVLSIIFFFSGIQNSIAYENEIENLSTVMTVNIASAGKKIVAVVDFTDLQGNVTELGRFLAEEFSIAIAGADKGFMVVDRTHLKSIIEEHKLSSTGLIDPQTARKLGKIAGVDALITGTITPFGDSIRLAVKVLDTETAKMISASSGNIARTKAIEELLARGIEVIEATPSEPKPGKKTVKKHVLGDLEFRFLEAKRAGKALTIYVVATNNGEKEFELRTWTRDCYLYDNMANKYKASSACVGTDKGGPHSTVEDVIIPGVSVKVSADFKDISSQASTGTLEMKTNQGKVVFRNMGIK